VTWLLYVPVVLMMLVGIFALLMAEWSSSESDYWYDVDREVRLNPARDAHYRPLLMWTREHRPSVWRRALGWESPEQRRRRAS
jgi:hypothetical protein